MLSKSLCGQPCNQHKLSRAFLFLALRPLLSLISCASHPRLQVSHPLSLTLQPSLSARPRPCGIPVCSRDLWPRQFLNTLSDVFWTRCDHRNHPSGLSPLSLSSLGFYVWYFRSYPSCLPCDTCLILSMFYSRSTVNHCLL